MPEPAEETTEVHRPWPGRLLGALACGVLAASLVGFLLGRSSGPSAAEPGPNPDQRRTFLDELTAEHKRNERDLEHARRQSNTETEVRTLFHELVERLFGE